MKKALKAALLFILIALLCSCSSTKVIDAEDLTDEDAAYAMEVALSTAVINAGRDFLSLTNGSKKFLPDSYLILDAVRQSVPGLSSILDTWHDEFASYIDSAYDALSESIMDLAGTVVFDDPFTFVNLSDTSASDYFLLLHGEELEKLITDMVSNAGFSTLEKARIQYNIYLITMDYVNGTSSKTLEAADAEAELSKKLYGIFTSLLARDEELFRTTPDPYLDPRVIAVFGNS